MPDWIYAIILGVIEGLTEFIPVSSTGMMLLAKKAMGLPDGFWDTFAVMIQLGAILAVVALYFGKLWKQVIGLPTDPAARQFALTVIVAFLPSVVLGLIFHDFIKAVLDGDPSDLYQLEYELCRKEPAHHILPQRLETLDELGKISNCRWFVKLQLL